MRNKLTDLNNHLFEQLERMNDAESPEEVEKEINRSKAIASLAQNIINNGKLMLDSMKFMDESGYDVGKGAIKPAALLGLEEIDDANEKIHK